MKKIIIKLTIVIIILFLTHLWALNTLLRTLVDVHAQKITLSYFYGIGTGCFATYSAYIVYDLIFKKKPTEDTPNI